MALGAEKPTGVRRIAALLALLTLGGCYAGLDAPPGGRVEQIGLFSETMRAWTRVEVVAPPGARRCWVDNARFNRAGLQRSDFVNADGVAMLAIDTNMEMVRIACSTPRGEVVREVHRVPLNYSGAVLPTMPPIIHVGGRDARSAQRWDALFAELCTINSSSALCPTKIWELREADIGD